MSRWTRALPTTASSIWPTPNPARANTAGTAVARGRLGEGRLEDVQVIYRQQPKVQGANHFGSRLVFARDGTLFVTQGDRFDYRDAGAGPVVRPRQDRADQAGRLGAARQPVRRPRRRAARDLVVRPSQHPERRAPSADRPAVDRGARGARRRRAEPAGGRQELRLARHHATASTTRGRRSAKARRSQAWSSRSTTGIR